VCMRTLAAAQNGKDCFAAAHACCADGPSAQQIEYMQLTKLLLFADVTDVPAERLQLLARTVVQSTSF
jgi:hypothetical protein